MENSCKQEIAKVVIKVLKCRSDSFPEDVTQPRNAPFHQAFLQAFSEKFDEAGTNVDAIIGMSSWMHGLNTTLGQTFFESVAHILSKGCKRSFNGTEYQIYSEQERIISEIMTSLKNGERSPNVAWEDDMLAKHAAGELVTGTNFTADCYIEDEKTITAIELKSVRPNSGETRGEKQKILKAKAALRIKFPGKKVRYFFGFPFDPTSPSDTGYNKKRFMENMIEFSKFCDEKEILLADELWSFLSGEANTMQELLEIIETIATSEFAENFAFINDTKNLIENSSKYLDIVKSWYLYDDAKIAADARLILSTKNRKKENALLSQPFSDQGEYNEKRMKVLLSKK